jgi:hypothetical protein
MYTISESAGDYFSKPPTKLIIRIILNRSEISYVWKICMNLLKVWSSENQQGSKVVSFKSIIDNFPSFPAGNWFCDL